MSVRFKDPIILRIEDDDDTMNDIVDRLDQIGFMPRFSNTSIYPYDDWREEFYEDTGTYPTFLMLTNEECDPSADGLTALLCDDEELKHMGAQLFGTFKEMSLERFLRLIDNW